MGWREVMGGRKRRVLGDDEIGYCVGWEWRRNFWWCGGLIDVEEYVYYKYYRLLNFL